MLRLRGPLLHFGVVVGEELDVLGAGQRVALLDELRERVADPGNDHAPGLDAAMAVDAVFERAQLEQVVDVEGERLGDFALDLDGPGARGQAAGVLRGVALVHAELVEVVVVGDVVVSGELSPVVVSGLGTVCSLVPAWTVRGEINCLAARAAAAPWRPHLSGSGGARDSGNNLRGR